MKMPLGNRVFPPREFRVAIGGRLADARIVPPTVPLPPLSPSPKPEMVPTAVEKSSPHATESESRAFSVTEIGRQLTADRQRIEAVLDNVRDSIEQVRREHDSRIQQWRQAVVEMSAAIASKLLHRQILDGEFPVENMIRDMSAQLHGEPIVRVRLNPSDLELLEQRLDGQPLLGGANDPSVVPDPTLGRGECRIDGHSSTMIADMTAQLMQIREDLLRSLNDARS